MTLRLSPVRMTVTRDLIREYAALSDDYNPIHVDPEYAAASPMGGVIAHGTLSLNLIWHSLELTFGSQGADCIITEVRFKTPVRENDALEAGGEIDDSGEIRIWVRNQHALNVIEGSARLKGP
ncbi:MAG: MaoC family dehydratase [Pseudomonadota bacterium]|nr:MaoC family dehydratase [Pseudomonadota bacterium]